MPLASACANNTCCLPWLEAPLLNNLVTQSLKHVYMQTHSTEHVYVHACKIVDISESMTQGGEGHTERSYSISGGERDTAWSELRIWTSWLIRMDQVHSSYSQCSSSHNPSSGSSYYSKFLLVHSFYRYKVPITQSSHVSKFRTVQVLTVAKFLLVQSSNLFKDLTD